MCFRSVVDCKTDYLCRFPTVRLLLHFHIAGFQNFNLFIYSFLLCATFGLWFLKVGGNYGPTIAPSLEAAKLGCAQVLEGKYK